MKARKIIASLLAITLLVSFFAGCSKTENEGSSSSNGSAEGSSSKDYSEHVKLTQFWCYNEGNFKSSRDFTDPNSKYYDERWKMLEEKFNISFDFVQVTDWAVYNEKLRTLMGANDVPDITMGTLSIPEYNKYAKGGVLKYFPADMLDKYKNIKRNLEAIKSHEDFKAENGQYFAVPRALDLNGVIDDYSYQFTYRKDWAKEVGCEIKDAYTIEEVYDMFSKIKKAKPDIEVYTHLWPDQTMANLGIHQYEPNIFSKVIYDKDQGKYVSPMLNPELIKGIKIAKKFYDEGLVNKDFLNQAYYEARNVFSNGKAFAYFDGLGYIFLNQAYSNFQKQNPDKKPEECIGSALLLNKDGKHLVKENSNYYGDMIVSGKVSDAAMSRFLDLFDYMLSEEGAYLTYFGIEGRDYKVEGDKFISTRKIDPETGAFVPFNKAKEVGDASSIMIPGLHEGPSIGVKNPAYSEAVRKTVFDLYQLRLNSPNVRYNYDAKLATFTSPKYDKFTFNALAEIQKIIITKPADQVEAAWNKLVNDNKKIIDAMLEEINSKIKK